MFRVPYAQKNHLRWCIKVNHTAFGAMPKFGLLQVMGSKFMLVQPASI